MSGRTALVTGATSGIGYETAKLLAQKGYRVLGTSRDPETIAADKRIPGVEYLALDLADRDSVAACAAAAVAASAAVPSSSGRRCS